MMKYVLSIALILLAKTSFLQPLESVKENRSIFSFPTVYDNAFFNSESLSKLKEKLNLPSDFELKSVVSLNQQLLALEKGTGRVLSIDSLGSTQRLDATKYGGDRFGSFEFVYKDTLYSIGGYGFWHVNGLVRRFDASTKDWNVVITNRSIPAAIGVNAIFLFNKHAGKVFILHEPYPDENTPKEIRKEPRVSLAIFDLVTKKWNETNYEIAPSLMRNISDVLEITHTDQTLIVHSKQNTHTLELDFENNKYYTLAPAYLTNFSTLSSQKKLPVYRTQNTKILIGDLLDNTYDSLETSAFRNKGGMMIYEAPLTERKFIANNNLLLGSICLNILLAAVGAYLVSKRTKQVKVLEEKEPLPETRAYAKVFTDLLDNTELQVVEKIWLNSQSETNTSIDEINKLLGIDKRPYKIQNNLRADALKLINKKFNNFTNTTDELIIRKRSDFDKRFFTYRINERYINKIILRKSEP